LAIGKKKKKKNCSKYIFYINFLPLGLKSCGPFLPMLDFAASTGTAYRGWLEGHCLLF
jgi:hypothetical protein